MPSASLDKEKALYEEMVRLGVKESDLVEKFIRASGPGGQNVNKTSTCVYIRHVPSGIKVKYMRERSQAQNRYIARRLLLDKIENLSREKLKTERQALEKLRRKMRKKSQAAKIRMLEKKRRHSQKKALRRAVKEID